MTNQNSDMRKDALLRRALVPKGYRPRRDADIERMLDTIGDEPTTPEKLQRMLRKIDGKEPMFQRLPASTFAVSEQLTEYERELVALHKAQGKPLPPDLAAKLKAMEDRASRQSEDPENAHGG